jgi:TP901 family phage tail tape measure protein
VNADQLKLLIEVAGKDTGALKMLNEQQKALGGLGDAAAVASKAILAVGAVAGGAMATGLVASVNAARGFEQTMSAVKAVSGATADEMRQLSGLALQLGKDTSFSAKAAGEGIEELVKGGLTIPDIMNGAAQATLNLAAAGGVELKDAAEIAANAMSIFNLKGADMAMVSDQIAGAANASSLSVMDFKMSLAAGGTVMAAAGQTFQQTAAAIALMGAAGIKGSDAGTSLKAMFNNLIPTTTAAKAAMMGVGLWTKEAGSAFVNLDGTFKDVSQISALLQKNLGSLTEAQRSLALETIFGSDGMRSAIVLTKAGAEGYDRMAGAMGKVTAAAVGAEKLNNLNGAIEQLKGSVETAGITFGMALLPMLKQGADAATVFVNGMIPVLETLGPKFVTAVQGAGTVIMGVIAGLRTGLNTGQTRLGLMEILGLDLDQADRFATVIGTVTDGIRTFVSMAAEHFRRLAQIADQAMNGDVAGAIGNLIRLFVSEKVTLAQTLIGWGRTLVEWIAPIIPPLLIEAQKLTSELWAWIQQQIPPLMIQLQAWGRELWAWVQPMIPPLLAEAEKLVGQFFAWVAAQVPLLLVQLGEWGKQLWSWVAPMIPPMLVEANALFIQLLGWITKQGPPLLEQFLSEWLPQAIKWIIESIPGAIVNLAKFADALKAWLEGPGGTAIGQMFLEFGKAAVVGLAKGWWSLQTWAYDELRKLIQGWVSDAAKAAPGMANEIGRAIVQGIQAGIAAAWEGFKNYLANQLNALVTFSKQQLRISSPSQVFADEVGRPIVDGILAGIRDGQPQLLAGMLAVMDALREQVIPAVDAITEAAERSKEAVGAWLEAFQESPLAEVADQAEAATWVIEGLTEAMEELAAAITAIPSMPGGGGGGGGIPGFPGGGGGGPGIPGFPDIPPGGVFPESSSMAAAGGGITVNVYPSGSILTSGDLIDEIYQGLQRLGLRQGGLTFSGSLS